MQNGMLKRTLVLVLAAAVGLAVFELGPGSLFGLGPITEFNSDGLVELCLAILSLGTPKRFMWLTLASWAFYFGWWSVYELSWLNRGDEKFGPMLVPYGIAAIVFGVASWISFTGRGGVVHLPKIPGLLKR
jgi:hypothetical protein